LQPWIDWHVGHLKQLPPPRRVQGGQRIAVQWKHAIVVGTGTKTAIVPKATTIKSAVPKSLFMTSSLVGVLVYGKQTQSALLGQHQLPVGHVIKCEPRGQLLASAGVAVRTAIDPTTAATTITKLKSFLRMAVLRGSLRSSWRSALPNPTTATREGDRPSLAPILLLVHRWNLPGPLAPGETQPGPN